MRAVFFDRDGVLNENRGDYVRSVDQLRLLPGALDALSQLAVTSFKLVVATNQAGVGRGIFSIETLEEIHAELRCLARSAGGRLDAIYACLHAPTDGCACRKPRPGLLRQAAADLHLDLRSSYFIGDSLTDVEAAIAAGCRPLLVRTGYGALAEQSAACPLGLTIVDDLAAAVRHILTAETLRSSVPYVVSAETRSREIAG